MRTIEFDYTLHRYDEASQDEYDVEVVVTVEYEGPTQYLYGQDADGNRGEWRTDVEIEGVYVKDAASGKNLSLSDVELDSICDYATERIYDEVAEPAGMENY